MSNGFIEMKLNLSISGQQRTLINSTKSNYSQGFCMLLGK